MRIDKFKKNTGLMIFLYGLLTLRSLFNRIVVRRNLNTGDRKSTAGDFLAYMDFCNHQLVSTIGITESRKCALEIGPGDNHCLALLVANSGYQKVETIDKYQLNYEEGSNYELYEAIARHFGLEGWETLLNRVERFETSVGLSDLVRTRRNHYDLIYSVSVIEHLWPWRSQLEMITKILNQHGQMVHIVNFTDHGMFSPQGNRFTFRKIPSYIYDRIMSPVGRPNRILPSDLMKFFSDNNFKVSYKVIRTHTHVLANSEQYSIACIPQKELDELLEQYNFDLTKNISEILDLCVGSAVFTITKND